MKMKAKTPEILWHNYQTGEDFARENKAIYCCDFQRKQENEDFYRLATGGLDFTVRIWYLKLASFYQPVFASTLKRHIKAVNCIRFSPDGQRIASGDDEHVIHLWKRVEKSVNATLFDDNDTEDFKEHWVTCKTLRGHIGDVYDVCWSRDGTQIVSCSAGSMDNSVILWDALKGAKLHIFRNQTCHIHGVALDPQGQFLVSMRTDRTMLVHDISNVTVHCIISKLPAKQNDVGESTTKAYRIFRSDDSLAHFRRPQFTPDGQLLLAPGGCREGDDDLNCVNVFARGSLAAGPALQIPTGEKAAVAVAVCPLYYTLRRACSKSSESSPTSSPATRSGTPENGQMENESKDDNPPMIDLPYRMVFAVATESTVLVYDTEQATPIALVTNIHYAFLSDLSWSSDGRLLTVASTDGYCTLIRFDEGELGEIISSSIIEEQMANASLKTKDELDTETMKENIVTEKKIQKLKTSQEEPMEASTSKTNYAVSDLEKSQANENGIKDSNISTETNTAVELEKPPKELPPQPVNIESKSTKRRVQLMSIPLEDENSTGSAPPSLIEDSPLRCMSTDERSCDSVTSRSASSHSPSITPKRRVALTKLPCQSPFQPLQNSPLPPAELGRNTPTPTEDVDTGDGKEPVAASTGGDNGSMMVNGVGSDVKDERSGTGSPASGKKEPRRVSLTPC